MLLMCRSKWVMRKGWHFILMVLTRNRSLTILMCTYQPNDLAERAVGIGGEGFGFDLQNFRHDSVPCHHLWQMVVETGCCTAINLTAARQLTLTLTITKYHHLAAFWQGGSCELQCRLACGPRRHRLLNKLYEQPSVFGKIVVHGEHDRGL
jgi:hypothetical protein